METSSSSTTTIAVEFVLQPLKTSSNQYRISNTERNGPGGI
jgi:hypothetical protein